MNEKTMQIEQIVKKVKECSLTPEEGLELIKSLGKTHLYEMVWDRYEFKGSKKFPHTKEPILFFGEDDSMYTVMKRQLEGYEAPFIYVTSGERFEDCRNGRFTMNFAKDEDYDALCGVLRSQNIRPRHIIHFLAAGLFKNTEDAMRKQLNKSLYSLFQMFQAFMANKLCPKAEILYLYENAEGEVQPIYNAVESFLKTVQAENPNFTCKAAELKSMFDEPFTKQHIADVISFEWNNQCKTDHFTCYEPRHYYKRQLQKVKKEDGEKHSFSVKKNGVYLITGGAGGLGYLFAEYLAKQAEVKLILTGRSPASRETAQKLCALENLGAEALYVPADISNEKETNALIKHIKQTFGELNGILHSAGLVKDAFIIKKTKESIEEVIAPKVFGTVWLDKAAEEEPLDFFVMFSSLSAVLPNAGQSDYAFANGCMDGFTQYRSIKGRPGKTLSINWPLWDAGNMTVGPGELQALRHAGLELLSAQAGLAAFQDSMSRSASRLAVISGDKDRISELLSTNHKEIETVPENNSNLPQLHEKDLKKQTVRLLTEIVGAETGRPADSILPEDTFDRYGIDSLTILGLNSRLEKYFGRVSKTLFFEYSSVEELSEYFLEHYQHELQKAFLPAVEQRIDHSAPAKREKLSVSRTPSAPSEEDIAIIGIAGRYPMAKDVEQFWENISSGKDCITEIPKERWDFRKYYHTGDNARHDSKWGGFIKDADKFDPLFFSISPRDAELIDPQERLFLETAWHTFEDAGYTKKKLKRHKTGVFVGVTYSHYQLFAAGASDDEERQALLSSYSSIANRVSYFFDLHGPSLAIDTMCSSSLSAVHFACESIKRGESTLAIAGGVNLSLHPDKYTLLSQNHFVSSDGRCRSFGAGGDGYVPGEGVGAVLLKSLSAAKADGDRIYGVIKGTSVNHGGKTNGYTVPNPGEQANVISETLDKAGIDADSISYIEAHGTGTSLGDPIEISGLTKALHSSKSDYRCAIGSVKSNIGHLEAAAGIASITKVLMQMKYKQLAPSLHSDNLNPNIDFEETPFYVQSELTDWETPQNQARRSGISSFGAGGSNAHIIIEEYKNEEKMETVKSNNTQIILLSAKNEERLRLLIDAYINELEPKTSLADAAYTSQTGRNAMEERLAVEVSSIDDLRNKLTMYLRSDHKVNGLYRGKSRRGAGQKNALSAAHFKSAREMAIHWVNGGDVQWEEMYTAELPKLVSLPAYPFERNRYWVPVAKAAQKQKKTGVPQSLPHAPIDLSFDVLKKSWKKQKAAPSAFTKGQVMILANSESERLAFELFDSDPLIESAVICADNWDHSDGEAKKTALAVIEENPEIIGMIDLSDLRSDQNGARTGTIGKLTLLQEIIKTRKQLFVLHVTRGLQTFLNDKPSLAGAETAGLYKMLSAEYQKIKSKTIDVDGHVGTAAELRQVITDEACADGLYSEICYRNGERYIPYVEKLHAAEIDRKLSGLPVCRTDQTLVITGGTRGIGAELARHYAGKGVKKLVLMGVTDLPESDKIAGMLEDTDEKSPLYSKLQLLHELDQKGVQVEVYSGPLTEKETLHRFFSEVRMKFGKIGGVIHCAGAANHSNPAFIHKSDQEIREVFEPKVQGMQVLHDIFIDDELDFFILFSSVASAFPLLGAGTSDYAAANAFMDYFAAYQHAAGRTYYQSINWPSWKDIGMGEVTSPSYQALGLLSHSTETGIAMLEEMMTINGYPCLIPAKTHPEKFMLQQLLQTRIQAAKNNPDAEEKVISGQGDNEAIIRKLMEIFSAELKIPYGNLDQDTSFADYGVDSILLVQLVKKAEDAFQIKIEPSAFLEYPSFSQLGVYLNELFASEGISPQIDSENIEVRKKEQHINQNASEVRDSGSQIQQTSLNQIAIIGMGCEFPDAPDTETFWTNLKKGKNSVREVPASRWDISSYYSDTYEKGKSISKWGGFLQDIESFDPAFFNMNKSEASELDPLIKKCLEVSVQTLRDGGYTKEEVSNKEVGVFIGSRTGTFMSKIGSPSKNTIVGIGQNFIGAHISHFFNLKGPNLVVDTACSSSLVSVHLACQSLMSKESDMAIAGGVDILLDQKPYVMLSEARALSPEGKCHTFDEKADGFVPGEGCGAVLLKRLDDALAEGDRIYAVIDSSAVNNDGQTMGMTTPNPKAQSAVIKKALKKGGIDADSLSYVETHGTGTMIGDPIELKALTEVFREVTEETQFCGVGSVKTNFGHLMSAAGIASIIKVALSIKNQMLPPTLHCKTPNPRFKFDQSPFFPNTSLKEWRPRKGVLRAGISSFGFGGTNAHMILSDSHLTLGYGETKRHPLSPVIFNKEQCWIDNGETPEKEESELLIPLLDFKEL
ncbi:SDR family NAD(P)-dependent oxidoreductase [Bacillus amyloliquefaciens]|uniref:SDR family NAD(P)-dependent oxidoreductase n=1 Tax=Bacillus amyloliquefaciens TaxID=1390 RepID=UPI0022578220|nr:SDR family NAD(P)-dependent oxidoreductase [Bacillus amyloliquefaciens]MCX4185477.1 SDR family NAD(P)-dependent oxidoreductase [Bacillus amyloliquefaciens]